MSARDEARELLDAASLYEDVTYASESHGQRPRKGSFFHKFVKTEGWGIEGCTGERARTYASSLRALNVLELRPCRVCWPEFNGQPPSIAPAVAQRALEALAPEVMAALIQADEALERCLYRLEWYREQEGATGVDAIDQANIARAAFAKLMEGKP